eukprot:3703383-Amphidinium_carterae.1
MAKKQPQRQQRLCLCPLDGHSLLALVATTKSDQSRALENSRKMGQICRGVGCPNSPAWGSPVLSDDPPVVCWSPSTRFSPAAAAAAAAAVAAPPWLHLGELKRRGRLS